MAHPTRLLLLFAAGLFLVPAVADASPWTLKGKTGAVSISTDYQWADTEWLISGEYQRFPLQGKYFGFNLRVGARYGITDRLEVGLRLALTHVEYSADEVYLGGPFGPDPDSIANRGELVDGLTSLDSETTGLGDVEIVGRFRITPPDMWFFTAAPELHIKVPTGYRAPGGTFADDGSLADDVTIGDGQADFTIRMHVGGAPHWRLFLRGDGGFRFRTFGPGHQVVGSFKLGGRIGTFFIPYAGVDAEHTVNEGAVIGTSFTTTTPEKPAREFTIDDVVATEYRLDRTLVRPSVGFIFSFKKYEVDVGYTFVAHGQNVAQLHILHLGTSIKW